MKTPTHLLVILLSWASSLLLPGQKASAPTGFGPHVLPKQPIAPTADTTTDGQLRERQNNERFGGITSPETEVRTHDLIATSTFLQAEGVFAVIPKGAVIHVPERLSTLVVESPIGKVQAWPEFLAANRNRVIVFDVTLEQAMGTMPLDSDKLQQAWKSGAVIVAVYKGGPISVPATSIPRQPSTGPVK